MSRPNTGIRDRLLAAMRSLDALERDVRSCQATAQYQPAASDVRRAHMATSDLELVLQRRKELGNVWGSDLERRKGQNEAVEVERLLAPLKLNSISRWEGSKQNTDEVLLGSGFKTLQQPPRMDYTIDDAAWSQWKKRIRARESSNLKYTPGHITTKIFDREDVVARVKRSKVALRVEDADDDSDDEGGGAELEEEEEAAGEEEGEEYSEGGPQEAVSIASTGSNIVVYRPPSEPADDIARTGVGAASPHKNISTTRQNPLKLKPKPLSIATDISRETVDLDRLQEVEDAPEVHQEGQTDAARNIQESVDSTSFSVPLKTLEPGEQRAETPDNLQVNAQAAFPTASPDAQGQVSIASSEWSFATSSGTGLFVSDKKRPKKSVVILAEGTVLGSHASRIHFRTPPPYAEEEPCVVLAPHNNETKVSSKKKRTKRKQAPSIGPNEVLPGNEKVRRRIKGTVEVGDLVPSTARRARPSRATMKHDVGLLVRRSATDDAVKDIPLSWQARGRGQGVTRAVPLSGMWSSSADGEY